MKMAISSIGVSRFMQYILGGVFIFSGLQKISNLNGFLLVVKNYKLLPASAENWIAIILPWIEFIIGSLLLLGIYIRHSALSAFMILILFILVITINIVRGIEFSCGCFSLSLEKSNKITTIGWLLRDFILLLMSGYVYWNGKKIIIENSQRRKHG